MPHTEIDDKVSRIAVVTYECPHQWFRFVVECREVLPLSLQLLEVLLHGAKWFLVAVVLVEMKDIVTSNVLVIWA